MRRRNFLVTAAAVLAAPRIVRGQSRQTLTFVPQADLAVLDPVWTTTYQTRDHGFLVFDTLFGIDAHYQPQPQMVDGVDTSADGMQWTLTLRPGMKFHDNTPGTGARLCRQRAAVGRARCLWAGADGRDR